MGRMYSSQGFQQRDNYASNYSAKNVKYALDKLIDVLQSPEQVRRLVIGHDSRRLPSTKPSKISFRSGPCPPGCSLSQYMPLAHLRCKREEKYVSLGRYHQMWARSLREYSAGGNVRPVPARYQQQSGPPPLAVGWSSVPCRPGYIEELTT